MAAGESFGGPCPETFTRSHRRETQWRIRAETTDGARLKEYCALFLSPSLPFREDACPPRAAVRRGAKHGWGLQCALRLAVW